MGLWHPPPGLTGDTGLVRVSSRMVRTADRTCPAADKAKAHPAVWPAGRAPHKVPDRTDFVFGPFMRALDLIEFEHRPVEAALEGAAEPDRRQLPPHDGLMTWTSQAVTRYLAATPDGAALHPYPYEWICRWQRSPADRSAAHTWELTVWGRRYRSLDGRVRELRLPRLGAAGEREREIAEVSVAAYVLAFGEGAVRPQRWPRPYRVLHRDDEVEWVRVVEYGCSDGSWQVLFEGTREEAAELYRRHGRDRLREVVQAEETRPGDTCADCKLLTVCPAPHRLPGLLGIVDTSRPRRTWSVTNGRDYRDCPAKEHLRRLHVPRQREYGPDAQRGQAVHALLRELHARGRACTPDDAPTDPTEWKVGRWHLTGEHAELGARHVLDHVSVCPLPGPESGDGVTDVRPEPLITVHDTAADVIVLVTPDLLYQEHGSWVWREVKTTRRKNPASNGDLLAEFPQVALGMLMLAGGVFGGDPAWARVELEILRPTGADLHLFDPTDPAEVARARKVIRELAAPWHSDQRHDPRPGPHCANCEVSRWCPVGPRGAPHA